MKKQGTIFFAILLAIVSACNRKGAGTREPPNFLIMIAYDAGWNNAGAYGHPHIQTPNSNKLAEEGMLFTNAFLTTSSCSPSRVSIMTGQYPHNTGASYLHAPLPQDRLIFPGELKDARYFIVAAGKWHLGPKRSEFDTIVGGGASGCEKWVKVLRDRPKEKLFFMWFAAFDPHRGYEQNIIPQPHTNADVIVPPFLPDNDSTRYDLAMYYDEISRLDHYIGSVLDELKEQGVDDNTMVIYMSDNRRPFPRCKTRLYIRNAFPELNASPPANAVRSPTYQEMIELHRQGGLEDDQTDCFITPRPSEELYDVVNDPFQLQNLADNPAYEEALNALRKKLDAWIKSSNDSIPYQPVPDKFDRWNGKKLN